MLLKKGVLSLWLFLHNLQIKATNVLCAGGKKLWVICEGASDVTCRDAGTEPAQTNYFREEMAAGRSPLLEVTPN